MKILIINEERIRQDLWRMFRLGMSPRQMAQTLAKMHPCLDGRAGRIVEELIPNVN